MTKVKISRFSRGARENCEGKQEQRRILDSQGTHDETNEFQILCCSELF